MKVTLTPTIQLFVELNPTNQTTLEIDVLKAKTGNAAEPPIAVELDIVAWNAIEQVGWNATELVGWSV